MLVPLYHGIPAATSMVFHFSATQPSPPGDPAGGQSKDGPIPIACVDVSDATWPGKKHDGGRDSR